MLIKFLDLKVLPKKPLKVTQVIYEIFINDNLDHFTVSQLKELYTTKVGDVDPVYARKTVYRQILRLQKLGMLSKAESSSVREHAYHKTALFYQIGLISKDINEIDDSLTNPNKYSSTEALLDDRLKKREVELIASLAESEEYMNLFESLPELQDELQSSYLRSREYSSKLLGQIKAIKSVIATRSK